MSLKAFYPGSFDPLTLGHIDIIQKALGFTDQLTIGVGVHHGKKAMLDADERVSLINVVLDKLYQDQRDRINVISFSNLAVDCARENNCNAMLRGLRDSTDYAYEVQMAGMNETMAPEITTLFLASSGPVRHIAANLVRQIASLGVDVSEFVPAEVASHLRQHFKNN